MAGNATRFYNMLILALLYAKMYIISSIAQLLLTTYLETCIIHIHTSNFPCHKHGVHGKYMVWISDRGGQARVAGGKRKQAKHGGEARLQAEL